MRKQVYGRKFKRDKNERKALFSGLISAMVLNGKIETTEEKAKAIRGDLEKMVTKAKKAMSADRQGESSKRLLYKDLTSFEVEKMINQIGPSFANRIGGYTRIIKTRKRFNDNARMAIMEWTEDIQIKNEKTKESKKVAKPVRKQLKEKPKSTVRKSREARSGSARESK